MKSIYFLSLNMIQFAPYAYGLLRSYAEQDPDIRENYVWQEPFSRMAPVDDIVGGIVDPALLFLSCYVWNSNQQLEIAKRVKRQFPDCWVVCGGPHIPNDSKGFFERFPCVDILVHGEGEIPVRALLLELLKKRPDLSQIAGISYPGPGRTTVQAPAAEKLPRDLPVPSPYLNGLLTPFFASTDKANKIALWETNRGCPFSCCFCDWGVRTTNKIRHHDMDRIKAEIEYFGRHRIEDVYITDANFGLFQRDLEIAKELVACKKAYGYPKRIRIQFAKNSNNTVLEISRVLYENDMFWGTTLSMQSVDMNVLEAIERPKISIESYKSFKEQYDLHNMPTYTELILGLPKETKESFIRGVCTLFDINMHDDFRTFELVLLPNAPLSQPAMREKYELETRFKPMRRADAGCETEYVELVFGTKSMSPADWEDCFVFSEMAQALHNGGYTRFLAIYLSATGKLSYFNFYNSLFSWALQSAEPALRAVPRVKRLIHDFYEDPEMPQINRALTQPDMAGFLASFDRDRKGWQLWTYIWLWISEHRDSFYDLLPCFLEAQGVGMTLELVDLMKYQKDIMLSLDYDPAAGKTVSYDYNWFDFFANGRPLNKIPHCLHYRDTHMGSSFQYAIEQNNRKKYVTAAIGLSYPYSKLRHFYHQPRLAKVAGMEECGTESASRQ